MNLGVGDRCLYQVLAALSAIASPRNELSHFGLELGAIVTGQFGALTLSQ